MVERVLEDGLETFFRSKNVKFFLALQLTRNVGEASYRAGLTRQHATKVLKLWRDAGYVEKRQSLHGDRYEYTREGVRLCKLFKEVPF